MGEPSFEKIESDNQVKEISELLKFESSEEQEYFEEIFEVYNNDIKGEKSLKDYKKVVKEELLGYLWEKKLNDGEISELLEIPKPYVGKWRNSKDLASNKTKKVVENKPKRPKRGEYARTQEEVERVVRFIRLAKSIQRDPDGNGKKEISLRKLLDKKDFD